MGAEGVLDAAYAVMCETAATHDRMAAMAGQEPTHRERLDTQLGMTETDLDVTDSDGEEVGGMASVVLLADWANQLNEGMQ